MPTYRFNGLVGEDHKVELPPQIPVGWAEIHVIIEPGVNKKQGDFQKVMREIVEQPSYNRSKEDIDAELRRERESWKKYSTVA
jgi:hypothetical protein